MGSSVNAEKAGDRVYPGDAASPPGVAFPGQGVDRDAAVGALRRHRAHPVVEAALARVGQDDPDELDFNDVRVSMPVIFAAGLATADRLLGRPDPVPVAMGHSLGEVTALTYAGAIDWQDGLELAFQRGEICHDEQLRRPGAMVAVMGTDQSGVEWMRRLATAGDAGTLEIAGLNGVRQIVLGGDLTAVQRLIEIAGEHGVLAQILPIGGAFHCQLMAGALPRWRAAVEATPMREPRIPTISTIDARVHTEVPAFRELLVRALLLPVRWIDAELTARELGVRAMWDAGPGQTLFKLARRGGVLRFVRTPSAPVAAEAGS